MANEPARPRDAAGSLAAAVFILAGAVAWWDTTQMSDPDSYVFPRTVVVLMVAFSLLLILRNLLRGAGQRHSPVEGSQPRRLGLVAVMLGGALAMPLIGFLPTGMIVFLAIMMLAMYDPWKGARCVVFPVVGVAVVVAFFVLFAEVLRVPLPVGSLFE
ncbi:tripartite tricarboxylate transporter TctB family protein [Pelagibius sp. CAU 1746]|uniref:tripartite tricarboxylate transporter TctB family protein n=1 Tax=Pelagibius sp. CAU 1746 TaxID=3140370 RepID=UPI00325B621B